MASTTIPSPIPPSESLFPTQQEANQLASLLNTNKPSLMMSLQLFSQMLRIFDNDDIHNFLFSDEPLQMSYLTNPNIEQISIACSAHETKIDPTSPPESSMSDRFGSAHFLTPVFTCNSITFGIGVENAIYYPSMAWHVPETTFSALGEFRFVKDDHEGYMLVVSCYDTECIRIEYIKTISPTKQIRCTMGTKRLLFRSATKGGSCNIDAVFPTLLILQTSYENRDCTYCGSKPSKCDCALQTMKPRHPLDHSSFIANMSSRLGTFYGVSHVSMYRENIGMCMGALGTRYSSLPSPEHGLVNALRNMAISRHALIQHPQSSLPTSQDLLPPTDAELIDSVLHNADQTHLQQPGPPSQSITDPLLPPNDFSFDVSDLLEIPPAPNAPKPSSDACAEIGITPHVQDIVMCDTDSSTPVGERGSSTPRNSSQSQENSSMTEDADPRQAFSNEEQTASDEIQVAPSSSSDKDVIRKLKVDLRREKNRAAAQRSNMRKKALNDSLKLSLKTEREKVDLLRSKEMLLREENLRLRQKLE
ncbi:unnamed protein product [Agarophyton chilense]|eukprot:gb/GEZJ01004159.1/.p1 GENE.gb/GEZJ01004159.1/~~gb/GEZJ01004159.1/.p1  ORF type:complete len:533 (+),score=73.55 gb/GEZJ01004159.1/:318-1916(+)